MIKIVIILSFTINENNMTEQQITAKNLTLYYSPHCPYCHRVLNAMVELGLSVNIRAGTAGDITLKDTFADQNAQKTLRQGSGRTTVPCLLIEGDGKQHWMFESLDIIAFLKTVF